MILLAEPFFGPFHGDFVIAGVGLHLVAVVAGALAEHFLADHWNSQNVADEIDDLSGRDRPLRYRLRSLLRQVTTIRFVV
jgi:hypothetical protein